MLNVVVLMGRLTANPEIKTTPNGVSVVTFSIAVQRRFAKQGEDRQADFIDIVAWRTTAEFICKYFTKGQMIAIQGTMQTRTYEDKNGFTRKVCEVVAENVSFTESKSNSSYSNENSFNMQNSLKKDEEIMKFSTGEDDEFIEITNDDDLPF